VKTQRKTQNSRIIEAQEKLNANLESQEFLKILDSCLNEKDFLCKFGPQILSKNYDSSPVKYPYYKQN
jgi:hypothetical protein